jgi:hypothetical protein
MLAALITFLAAAQVHLGQVEVCALVVAVAAALVVGSLELNLE